MSFNPDPSKQAQEVIHITKSKRPTHSPLVFNNVNVSQTFSLKHLGVILDFKLTLENHLNNVVAKVKKPKRLGLLRLKCHFFDSCFLNIQHVVTRTMFALFRCWKLEILTGGIVKNVVFRAVLSGKTLVQTPKDFADYANGNSKGIACIYIPQKDIPDKATEIESTRCVKEMSAVQVHMIKRQKTTVFYL